MFSSEIKANGSGRLTSEGFAKPKLELERINNQKNQFVQRLTLVFATCKYVLQLKC
jgi:hypothetical protein